MNVAEVASSTGEPSLGFPFSHKAMVYMDAGQLATVKELKEIIPQTHFWSQKLLLLRNLPSPFHYAFYDKTGSVSSSCSVC